MFKKTVLLFTLLAGFVSMTYASGAVGTAGAAEDASRSAEYMYVYNADRVSHPVGSVMVFNAPATNYPGLEVSTTTTANNSLVAGVVALNAIPATGWGFIQTYGYHPAVKIAQANTAGDILVTTTTAESSGLFTIAMATGTATQEGKQAYGPFAITLETTTSSTTVKAFIVHK